VIRVMPLDQLEGHAPVVDYLGGGDPLSWAPHRRFLSSGRSALDAVLQGLALSSSDEVFITNSSGQTYISPCVTCTVFNHCRPSRVLTDQTRAMVVIHEYGYPHPRLAELCGIGRHRGIPVIEDCAHSLDSSVEGVPLGSVGDFAIFSLSKVLPVSSGGILVGPENAICALSGHADAEAAYSEYFPALAWYSHRRKENYDAVRKRFPDLPLLLEAEPGITPFYIGLLMPRAPEIKRRSTAVEWGSTLREELLLVTTNPFVEADILVNALESAFVSEVPA
jgi:hypothetical protein